MDAYIKEISIGALKYMDVFSVGDFKEKYMFLYYDKNDFNDPIRCLPIDQAKNYEDLSKLTVIQLSTTCNKVKLYGRIYNP